MVCKTYKTTKKLSSCLDFLAKQRILINVFSVVSVAQLVEHQVVVLGVMGSIPIAHPKNFKLFFQISYFSKKNLSMSGRSAIGSALALGARGCEFKSRRPDQSSLYRASPGTASTEC
jgi:hypothetical protein